MHSDCSLQEVMNELIKQTIGFFVEVATDKDFLTKGTINFLSFINLSSKIACTWLAASYTCCFPSFRPSFLSWSFVHGKGLGWKEETAHIKG